MFLLRFWTSPGVHEALSQYGLYPLWVTICNINGCTRTYIHDSTFLTIIKCCPCEHKCSIKSWNGVVLDCCWSIFILYLFLYFILYIKLPCTFLSCTLYDIETTHLTRKTETATLTDMQHEANFSVGSFVFHSFLWFWSWNLNSY